jgi:hypothetical protein
LGIPTFSERGKLFYPSLRDHHFYADGTNFEEVDRYGLSERVRERRKERVGVAMRNMARAHADASREVGQ